MIKKIQIIKKNKILKNISVLFSGTIVSSILGFINIALLIKSIGLEANGIIFLCQSYIDFFNSLLNFQSFESVIKFLPSCMDNGNKKGKNYIKLGILFDLTTAIISLIVSYLFLDIVANYLKWNLEIINYIKLMLLIIPFTINGSLNGILRVYSKFKELSYTNILLSILTTCFYIIAGYFKFKLILYVSFIIFKAILKFIIDFYLVYKTLKENHMLDFNLSEIKYDKNFLKFSMYSSFSKVLDIPVSQLIPLILSKYLGVVDIAIYKILEKIGSIVSILTGVIFQVIAPEISKEISNKNIENARKIVCLLMKYIFLLGLTLLILVFLTKNYWLNLFIPNYNNYILEITLYLIFVIIVNMTIGYHPLFLYLGYVKEVNYILIAVNSVYIFILYYSTIYFGLAGVIFSKIIQAVTVIYLKIVVLKKNNFIKKI